jgi:hypothetical protein
MFITIPSGELRPIRTSIPGPRGARSQRLDTLGLTALTLALCCAGCAACPNRGVLSAGDHAAEPTGATQCAPATPPSTEQPGASSQPASHESAQDLNAQLDRLPPDSTRAALNVVVHALGPATASVVSLEVQYLSADGRPVTESPERAVVTARVTELDDSIALRRYRYELERDSNSRWRFVQVGVDWACRAGRGHSDYSRDPCL